MIEILLLTATILNPVTFTVEKAPEPLTVPAVMEEAHEVIHPYRLIVLTPDDQELLYATVFAEAGNQGKEGMKAVAQVILNRVLNGHWGDNVEAVISAPGQFSVYPASVGGIYSEECKEAVDEVLMGEDLPLGEDAIYFSQGQVPGTDYIATIKDHVFSR